MIVGRDAEIAALVQRLEVDREARHAEMQSIQARSGELEADNRRLGEERDRAEALASELRAALEEREAACQEQARVILERDAEVATLTERAARSIGWNRRGKFVGPRWSALRGRLDAIASENRRLGEERNEMASRLEARIAELTGQIGGLAAEFARMGSGEGGREDTMLQIRDLLSARQDDIQAMVSRLSGTVDYSGMVRRVRADMRRLLPPAARVIVISKGDPDLLDVEGQHARHFPQDEQGDYAGHYPAESGEAIAHLEALRARGGRFLVIPSSAFWWLEHYADLAHHLDTNYQNIWKSADCQIYELERPDQSRRRRAWSVRPRRHAAESEQRREQAEQLIQAMAQLVQPIADLRNWIRPGPLANEPPAPSTAAPPAPPAPEPGSMLAVCDMPGADPVTIGPGHLRVKGWALAKSGIEDVSVFVNGLPREGVAYGTARFDVEAEHPEFPNAHHSGFVGKIDLEGLADGEHSLVIRVRSRDGCEMELNRSFRIDPDARPDRRDLNAEYPEWLARRTPSESDLARMRVEGMNLRYQPVISLVVPVYNTPETT